MAIARVGTAKVTGSASGAAIAAPSANHTAGNFIAVMIHWEDSGNLTSVTDTAGNTYTLGTFANNTTGPRSRLAWCTNITGHATNVVQANFDASVPFGGIVVTEYSGVTTSTPLDVQATLDTGSWTNGVAFNAASINTTVTDLLIAVCGGYQSETFTPGAGWTELSEISGTSCAMERLNVASGTYTVDATATNTSAQAIAHASFKAAAGGNSSSVSPSVSRSPSPSSSVSPSASQSPSSSVSPSASGAVYVERTVLDYVD